MKAAARACRRVTTIIAVVSSSEGREICAPNTTSTCLFVLQSMYEASSRLCVVYEFSQQAKTQEDKEAWCFINQARQNKLYLSRL